MIDRTTKLRWRRRVRKSKRHVETIGEQAEQHLEQHVIRRLGRLWNVRRFLLSWVVLVVMLTATLIAQTRGLSQYYQSLHPIPGGTYTEGVIGTFTNANPLYATGSVDSSVARLIFSGLFKYDQANRLVGDLAESWQVNERGNVYTVTLRANSTWHDGKPVTAEDIVFTYATIQNPDAKSPLESSWRGVKLAVVNNRTVTFTLPQSLSSFPYAMTNGIVPKHRLAGVPASQLRSIAFNTNNPVGAGPFKWKTIEVTGTTAEDREERVGLSANETYIGGKPKLDGFVIRAFHNQKALIGSFERQELDGVTGLSSVPDELKNANSRAYNMPLSSATMVFFKTSADVLADARIRRALVHATNQKQILQNIGYPVQAVQEPILKFQVGYDPKLVQLGFDKAAAGKLLDEAGWKLGENGLRTKDNRKLTFRLLTESTPEYSYVTSELQKQWRAVGVDAEFILLPASDLQTSIAQHTYDALLYGISLGVDPDMFAYWHSSQADIRSANRLNFSEYKSTAADRALEAGRTRSDVALRVLKYRPFLEAWRNDAPAVGLYQPRFLYIARGTVHGLEEHTINTGVDRYANVENWMTRVAQTDNL